MKKSILIILVFLVCAIQSTTAYEYFTIYFRDGTKSEAFYATDVDSICYSKLSLDSIAYDDWQVQEIYTCDSVYRYPLAKIDSLSFKDVDINKVAEDIANAMEKTDKILLAKKDNNIESYLPEIAQINGVEDACYGNRQLYLKIKDWGNIVYYDPPKEPQTVNMRNISPIQSRIAAITPKNQSQQNAPIACIANQQAKDISRTFFTDIIKDVTTAFSAIGIQTKTIPMPEPSFFSNDIFDYDIAFIKTHGWYDIRTGLHWLMTGQEVLVRNENGADYNSERLKQVIQMEQFSPRKICLASVDELRNGDSVKVFYIAISEEFIKIGAKKGNRRTIIFNTACQSVMGPNWKSEVENIPNYSLAKAYIDHGAGCYLGFDDSNSIGAYAGESFFFGMMNGLLVKDSYSEVQTFFTDYYHQDNYDYYDEKGKLRTDHTKRGNVSYIDESHPTLRCYPENSTLTITRPQTLEAEEIMTGNSRQIRLHGNMRYIKFWNSDNFPYTRDCDDCNIFGFYVADNPEMNNMSVYKGMGNYDESNYTFSYEVNVETKEDNKTYYYCAVMNNGYSNCYGDFKQFTTNGDAEAYAVLNDSTLTFYYDKKKGERKGKKYVVSEQYFYVNDIATWGFQTSKVVFDSSFARYTPQSTAFWFLRCEKLQKIENLQYLNTSNATDMGGMFKGCSSLTSLDLSSFNTSNVTNMSEMFYECSSLTSLDLSSFNTSNVTNMGLMFSGCSSLVSIDVSHFNTSNVTSMLCMFSLCRSLTSLDVSNFNTTNVTSMSGMFSDCSSLTTLDLSSFNMKNVMNAGGMIGSCESLTYLDCSNFYFTDESIHIFSRHSALKTIKLNNVNTEAVTNMSEMFYGCSSLTSIDVSHFNTSNVTDMSRMFGGCSSLTSIDVSHFNTSNVTDMGGMFLECSSLTTLDLSSLNISNVRLASNMFEDCTSMTTIYAGNWNLIGGYKIFYNCNSLVGGQGTKIGNNLYGYDKYGNPLYYYCGNGGSAAHIDGGKDNPGLFTGK